MKSLQISVLLVNSGNDPGLGGNANAVCYPPLNIISLGSELQRVFGEQVVVTLIDGQIESMDTILARVRTTRPDLLGVSMYCTSIRNSILIIQEGKGVGAVTIAGNDHAAVHWETLLTNIRDLDAVCVSDVGEPVLVGLVAQLLRENDWHPMFGLATRDHNGIPVAGGLCLERRASDRFGVLNAVGIPDRLLIEQHCWNEYLYRFRSIKRKLIDPMSVSGVATINRARGCGRVRRACSYCGISDLTLRGSSPSVFWSDVRAARMDVGANYLYEGFDSATSWPSLLERWARDRPDDLADTRFFMYAQAAETTVRTVRAFQNLGVSCVNSGFDSGDDMVLKLIKGPRDSLKRNIEAAQMWSDAGIEIYTSFVAVGLGNDSDTMRGLENTLRFAEWLAESSSTVSLDAALLYPDRGSAIGRWLWSPACALVEAPRIGWGWLDFDRLKKVSDRWKGEVYLDLPEMCADFAWVCRTKPDLLYGFCGEIEKLCRGMSMNYGQSQGGRTLVAGDHVAE